MILTFKYRIKDATVGKYLRSERLSNKVHQDGPFDRAAEGSVFRKSSQRFRLGVVSSVHGKTSSA